MRGHGASPAHVYLVVGEEAWLRRQAVERIISAHLTPEERELNLDRLEAAETEIHELLTRADTLPFFGSTRVVVVRGLDRMPAASQERLCSYLEAGPPPCVLVLEAASLDRRRRLWGVLQRVAQVVEANPVDSRQAAAWVVARVREAGKRITGEAAQALVAAAGTDLEALAGEVDKLVAYAHDRSTVELADVEAVASHGAEVSVFALTDAVAQADGPGALRVLDRLLQRESAVGLVGLLASHFRALLYTSALARRQASSAEVRAALGSRAWLYPRYREQLRRFPPGRLAELYRLIQRTDLALKSSGGPPEVLVQQLVVQLCEPRTTASGGVGGRA